MAVVNFKLMQGQLKTYAVSPSLRRHFYGECGSPIDASRSSQPETYGLRLGTLDQAVTAWHQQHVFVADQTLWHDIVVGEARFDAYD